MRRIIFVFSFTILLVFGPAVDASTIGESVSFNVDKSYDISGRAELPATLIKTSADLYFFIDKNWWALQNNYRQSEILNRLEALNQEFTSRIYPILTATFGSEWKPGIDGDSKITVLFQPMKEGAAGYFRSVDEYLKLQFPDSNEREMIYLATSQLDDPQLKSFLAHEFIHLITFNQKDRAFGVNEETWLNEARAEYAPTLLGYDEPYEGSNLWRRVKSFLEEPLDPLTEWQGRKSDYGVLNLFTQYLMDHYGVVILADSLKAAATGIPTINEALSKNRFNTDFSQIFTDWSIAILINNCSLGPKYCYLNNHLKELKISPAINFLPLSGKSTLAVTNVGKNWAGNWQKIIAGQGVLKLEFSGLAGLNYRVPYLIENAERNYSLGFLSLDKNEKGVIYVSDFGTLNKSLIIIPTLQTKITGFNGVEPTYPFTITVSIAERTPEGEAELVKTLLVQIELLKEEIAKAQIQLNALLGKTSVSCKKIENNLYFGMKNNPEVSCLQEFLKLEGKEIYPEGIISGNFLSLTKTAVIRFQEKYSQEILKPLGLEKGTGFVGEKTRAVIDRLVIPLPKLPLR